MPWLVVLNVHDTDQWHCPAPQEEDGEEYYDDGGGANELALLNGLQAQMKAQSVWDSTSQACQSKTQRNERKYQSNYILITVINIYSIFLFCLTKTVWMYNKKISNLHI